MASKPEITTTLETPSSPKRTSKEFEDALLKDCESLNSTTKNDCPQRIQHRLSLRLSNSPSSSPQNVCISPRSPNRSNSPLVNKLYEEELLCNELITTHYVMTNQVNENLIEAVKDKINSASNITNKQLYSPNKSSPETKERTN